MAEKIQQSTPPPSDIEALRAIMATSKKNAGETVVPGRIELQWQVHAMAWDRFKNGWYPLTANCPELHSGNIIRQTNGMLCDVCEKSLNFGRHELGEVSVKAWVEVSVEAWGHSMQHGLFLYHLCKKCWDEEPHNAGGFASHYNHDCWGCERENR